MNTTSATTLRSGIPGLHFIRNTTKIKSISNVPKPPMGDPYKSIRINKYNHVMKPIPNFFDQLIENVSSINNYTFHIRVEFNQKMLDASTEYGVQQIVDEYRKRSKDKVLRFKVFISRFLDKKRWRMYSAIRNEYLRCVRDAEEALTKYRSHSYIARYSKFNGSEENYDFLNDTDRTGFSYSKKDRRLHGGRDKKLSEIV